jgi:hypothetical protein
MPPLNTAQARPNSLKWALTLLGGGVLLFGLVGADVPHLARWIAALGGATIILLAPAAVRSMVTEAQLTEDGVTGAGFLAPVHIPWTEVVLVSDDSHGVIIQSASRSTRIDLSTVTISSTFGSARIGNFENADEMVRFILAHVPKSTILEMHYWMPT